MHHETHTLVWDHSGFWLCSKRLERGTFAIPTDTVAPDRPEAAPLSTAEVHLLLEGINVHHATYHPHYHRLQTDKTVYNTRNCCSSKRPCIQ